MYIHVYMPFLHKNFYIPLHCVKIQPLFTVMMNNNYDFRCFGMVNVLQLPPSQMTDTRRTTGLRDSANSPLWVSSCLAPLFPTFLRLYATQYLDHPDIFSSRVLLPCNHKNSMCELTSVYCAKVRESLKSIRLQLTLKKMAITILGLLAISRSILTFLTPRRLSFTVLFFWYTCTYMYKHKPYG